MNVHESEKLAGIMEKLNISSSNSIDDADIIVFNTCCIRENAEQHAYGNIGALKNRKKNNKGLIVAVGGCMTQQNGAAEKLKKTFPFVDIVFGTHNLCEFEAMLKKKLVSGKGGICITESERVPENLPITRSSFPNAWVNVMYGCNNFCSYCIVPYVRGRERSRAKDDIVREVAQLVQDGYKEITLLGQNVNSYGKDLSDGMNFAKLLDDVAQIPGKYRLRFMSNHPKDFNSELIEVIAKHENICKCIHLPLQSGSDRILSLMNRKYSSADYLAKIEALREAIPNCAVTSDVMVGFPNETEDDFLQTMDVVRRADFSGAFTFVYSRRKGTVADKMDGHIDDETKKDRIMRLVALQNSINRTQAEKYKGTVIEVLCEDFDCKRDMYLGRDEYGKMGYFKNDFDVVGKFVKIKVNDCNGMSLYGDVVEVL